MSEEKRVNPVMDMFKQFSKKTGELAVHLFKADKDDVDLKSDVIYPEDVYISVLKFNGQFLKKRGQKDPYKEYINDLLRVRFSMERKSREEFTQTAARPLNNLQIPTVSKDIEEVRK